MRDHDPSAIRRRATFRRRDPRPSGNAAHLPLHSHEMLRRLSNGRMTAAAIDAVLEAFPANPTLTVAIDRWSGAVIGWRLAARTGTTPPGSA